MKKKQKNEKQDNAAIDVVFARFQGRADAKGMPKRSIVDVNDVFI